MMGAVRDLTIDEPTRGALARLTANEKECLRRRLLHQTAKEMALDLGISPHAVEKRLKMARTKLGLSSSLDAARLLADFEQYQHPGPHAPDLASDVPQRQKRLTKLLVFGGIAMSMFAAGLIILAAQAPISGGAAPLDAGGVAPYPPQGAAPVQGSNDAPPHPGMRKASWDETAAFLSDAFKTFDKDHSGFLDPAEASVLEPRDAAYRDNTLPPAPPAGQPDPAAETKWMAKLDENRDGKVSAGEYVSYMMPWTLLNGIPRDWKAPANGHD